MLFSGAITCCFLGQIRVVFWGKYVLFSGANTCCSTSKCSLIYIDFVVSKGEVGLTDFILWVY